MKYARTLGLALAIGAFTAFGGASSASALQYNSSSSPVMLFAEDNGKHVFTVDEVPITCNRAVFEKASLATPANTIPSVTAAYSGCKAWFEGLAVTVNMGNCKFDFQQPSAEATSLMSLNCVAPEPKPITMSFGFLSAQCSIAIHELVNTNLTHVKWANNTPTVGKVTASVAITNLVVVKNVDNLNCPYKGIGTTNNATYNGLIPIEGTGGINLWVS